MKTLFKILLIFVSICSWNGIAWASYTSDVFLKELTAIIDNAGGEFVFKREKDGKKTERISQAQIDFTISQFFETDTKLDINIYYDYFLLKQVSENRISLELSPFSSVTIKSENFLDDSIDLLIEFKQTPIPIYLENVNDIRKIFINQELMTQEISRVVLNGSEIAVGFEIDLRDYISSIDINTDSQKELTKYEVKSEIKDLSISSEIIDPQNGFGTQITRVFHENINSEINLSLPNLDTISSIIDNNINPLDRGLSLGFFYERSAGLSESIISNQDLNIFARMKDNGVQRGLGLSRNGINLLSRVLDLHLSILSNEFSAQPLKTEIDEVSFEMQIPFLNRQNGSSFKFYFNIDDLSMSENIWNFVDIEKGVFTDPISFGFDLTGNLNWLFNLMDLKDVNGFSANNPVEIINLDVNEFKISLGELEMKSSGSFIFLDQEFDALSGFGLRQPVGEIRVELQGAYSFIDKIMSEQLIDQQTGIFILGLITLYTKTGNADDNLISVIRITDSGEILINNKLLQ